MKPLRVLISSLSLLLISAFTTQAQTVECGLQQMAIDAALGDERSQYNLGVEFFSGRQLPRDYGKAANLWRKAADAGSVPASNNLGFLKYFGRPGVERNYEEGLRLWRFAAERGFPEAQVHLGQAYSDGRFLKSDFIEAYAWAKAGKHYSARASDWLDDADEVGQGIAKDADVVLAKSAKALTDAQLAEAEKKAADYISRFAPR